MKKQLALLCTLAIAMGVPAGLAPSQSWTGFTAVAQSNRVSGDVKDANGEPMIGVNVRVKGTNTGTTTDLDGRYSIKADPNQTLVFSFVGYDAIEIPASQAANVQLTEGANTLQDVVVTAEFGMKRVARTVGSSVQNVKAQDIIESGRTDFISALQGRVSGMSVVSSGGAPGASTTVVLRSATSLSGNNQPLYVIDGIPMNNTSFNPTTGLAAADGGIAGLTPRTTDYSSRGNDFNPEDIESMTVLKGAAAAALYGSDASNGAIIITTKKGRSGRARVTYSNQFTWSKAYGWPEVQDKYTNGAYGAANFYFTRRYGSLYDGSLPYYDNAAAVLQTGFMHRHNLSLETGNEKMSLRASASYFDQDGVIKTTSLTRTNLSLCRVQFVNVFYENGEPIKDKVQYGLQNLDTKEYEPVGEPVAFGEVTSWFMPVVRKTVYNSSGSQRRDVCLFRVDPQTNQIKERMFDDWWTWYIGRAYRQIGAGNVGGSPALTLKQFVIQ